MNPIILNIAGEPEPAGSKRGFAIKVNGQYTGSVAIMDANKKSAPWKKKVAIVASMQYHGPLLTEALRVQFDFVVIRPTGHYRTGKNASLLKDSAPAFPAVRPDVLKLSRAVEDALTEIVWKDDAQIVTEIITKRYGPVAGVVVTITQEQAQEGRLL